MIQARRKRGWQIKHKENDTGKNDSSDKLFGGKLVVRGSYAMTETKKKGEGERPNFNSIAKRRCSVYQDNCSKSNLL